MTADRHLVAKLKALLEDADLRLLRTRTIPDVGASMGAHSRENDRDVIEIALRQHHSVDELVHSVIHELLHAADYPEEAVSSGLDNGCYTSRVLREAVMARLLEVALHIK